MARNSVFRLCNSLRRGRVSTILGCSAPYLITSLSASQTYSSVSFDIPTPKPSVFHRSTLPSSVHHFSSSSSADNPSNIILIKTEAELNNAYSKVKDDSLPAIFYFTAAWCGPCRMIAPVIKNWSEEFPHVTTFKIDIDEAGLQGALGKLGITAVPTLHFFHNGKKESEVVGADIGSMNETVQRLFK